MDGVADVQDGDPDVVISWTSSVRSTCGPTLDASGRWPESLSRKVVVTLSDHV
jgi:hypothetical protein